MKTVVEVMDVGIARANKMEDADSDGNKFFVDVAHWGGKMSLRSKLEKYPEPTRRLKIAVECELEEVKNKYGRAVEAFVPKNLVAFEQMK